MAVSTPVFNGHQARLTLLSVPLSHTLAAAAAALDGAHDPIEVRRAAPFLVGENIDPELLLSRLDHAHVGEHAFVLEAAGELRGNGRGRVQPGEGDQLQDESGDVSTVTNTWT